MRNFEQFIGQMRARIGVGVAVVGFEPVLTLSGPRGHWDNPTLATGPLPFQAMTPLRNARKTDNLGR